MCSKEQIISTWSYLTYPLWQFFMSFVRRFDGAIQVSQVCSKVLPRGRSTACDPTTCKRCLLSSELLVLSRLFSWGERIGHCVLTKLASLIPQTTKGHSRVSIDLFLWRQFDSSADCNSIKQWAFFATDIRSSLLRLFCRVLRKQQEQWMTQDEVAASWSKTCCRSWFILRCTLRF